MASGEGSELLTLGGYAFLEDDVIRAMLEEVDPETLKTLREMNSNWNHLSIKELGKRASEGQLSEIEFTLKGLDDKIAVEQTKAKFDNFLKDTQRNLQLFKSFRFNFPELINFMDPSFFSTYTPAFVNLGVSHFKYPKDEFRHFLFLMSPQLEEFNFSQGWFRKLSPEASCPWTIQAQESKKLDLIFPNLTSISCDKYTGDDEVSGLLLSSRAGPVDPTPRLHILDIDSEQLDIEIITSDLRSPIGCSRWSKLTQLNIKIKSNNGDELIRMTRILLSMAQAGMKLTHLLLELDTSFTIIARLPLADWPAICKNFSRFFELQSKSLEILIFIYFSLGPCPLIANRIQLPVFEVLHLLHIEWCMDLVKTQEEAAESKLFDMGPLPSHFPKLKELSINTTKFLATLYPNDVNAKFHLQKLNIGYYKPDLQSMICNCSNFSDWIWFESKLGSVDDLRCFSQILASDVTPIPFGDSLKVLKITAVKKPLQVSHLTALEEMYVNWGYRGPNVDDYLGFFQQVRELKLSQITFIVDERYNKIPDDVKAKFEDWFPFQVKYLGPRDYCTAMASCSPSPKFYPAI